MYPAIMNPPTQEVPQTRELSRLLTAAIVNPEFCNLLLTNPPIAISSGYNGEKFDISSDAQSLILSIRATSLKEFAAQLIMGRIDENGISKSPISTRGR